MSSLISRRAFTSTALTSGVAAPLILRPTSAQSFIKIHDGESAEKAFGSLVLSSLVIIAIFVAILASRAGSHGGTVVEGIKLPQKIPLRPIDRSGAVTGLLGGLAKQPLSRRFGGADEVASLHQLGNVIGAVPHRPQDTMGARKLVIAHEENELEPSGQIRKMRLTQDLVVEQFAAARRVGTLYRKGNEMLAAVPPHSPLGIG